MSYFLLVVPVDNLTHYFLNLCLIGLLMCIPLRSLLEPVATSDDFKDERKPHCFTMMNGMDNLMKYRLNL